MLAIRDQENLVNRQAVRNLQPKTPGQQFPKTPLKVPLNDENAGTRFGGKSVLRTKGNNENAPTTAGKSGKGLGKSNLATPMGMCCCPLFRILSTVANLCIVTEPRTSRAPLGNKTTNAKARTTATGGVKDIVRELEQTQTKPATTKRQKQAGPHLESSKLEVHTDKAIPLGVEEDIEYAPPRPKVPPYESDIIPQGALTFECLKPENRLRGYYDYYFNRVDENGVSESQREMEKKRQQSFKQLDEQVKRDMDELDWGFGNVSRAKQQQRKKGDAAAMPLTGSAKPDTKPSRAVSRHPPTLASRRAASALSVVPKPTAKAQTTTERLIPTKTQGMSCLLPGRKPAPRPAPTRQSSAERATAVAASRTTLGYSKGRSASSVVQRPERRQATTRTLTRTASTASSGSDVTITPARFARRRASKQDDEDGAKRLELLSIFDPEEGDDDEAIGEWPVPEDNDFDDGFELKVGPDLE